MNILLIQIKFLEGQWSKLDFAGSNLNERPKVRVKAYDILISYRDSLKFLRKSDLAPVCTNKVQKFNKKTWVFLLIPMWPS